VPKPTTAMRRDLPDNLYERDGYYSWRNPETGKEYGIGRDKAQAIAQARDANHFLEETITGAFREARDLAGITVPAGKTPPTFHELRSLGIRLYKKQGYDPQALAGHRDPETTRIYTDTRGAEWIDVAA
jgi:integrase